jgi:hypothetical protein
MSRAEIDAISKNVAEGEAIVAAGIVMLEHAQQRWQDAQPYRADTRILVKDYKTHMPEPRPVPPAADEPLSIASMVEQITQAEARGRPVLAALGLARLREFHEATNPAVPWADFARRHVPLARDRVEALIGRMVHRGALLRCVKCGTQAKAPCACGVPFVSEHPWANADPLTKATALERAAAAVAAHPEKSNRAIAAEICVGLETVRRARAAAKAAAPDGSVDGSVDRRVGRDGRRRKVPATGASAGDDDRDESQPGGSRKSFLLRAHAAWQLATYSGPAAEVDEDCRKLAETAAAAWASVAQQLREMKP